ncbi:MAG: hypothetical protein ACREJG_13980 [Candidatus Rokuibacteriota bacterium]
MSTRPLVAVVAACLAGVVPAPVFAARPGVLPDTPWSCPESHPIKGYVSHESGLRVYHLPGGPFYEEASPERCYASEEEAARDGRRPARERQPRWRPPPPLV